MEASPPDNQTVALIVDDGGYEGTDPANPTPVPDRPIAEIEELVSWLQENLPRTPP